MSDTSLFYFMRKDPVRLLRYLPNFLSSGTTFKNAQDTLSWEHEQYRLKLVEIARQFFLETCNENGLADWERFLNLVPDETATFDERKAVARVKLRGADTMTIENTLKLMREFMTSGTPGIEELGENEIRLILDNGVYRWKELFQALFEYLPAHLAFSLDFELHQENNLWLGFPTADIEEIVLDGANLENVDNQLSTGIVIQDCGVDVITYDSSDVNFENALNYGFIQRDWERIEIAAEVDDDFDSEFEKLLWEKWLKWKHNPLVEIYNHHFDDDDGEIDPDEPEIFPLGNFLRLYWKFPYTRRLRYVTIANPRENIMADDIKSLSLFGAANEVLKNSRGWSTDGIVRALIVNKTEEKIL